MSRKIRRRLTYPNIVATLALVVATAGGSLAIGQSADTSASKKRINACVRKSTGTVRIVGKPKCRKPRERLVTWNRRGLAGAAGPAGVDAVAASGMVGFFDAAACPTGWTVLAAARGRYVVGLPEGGTLNATVGTALSGQEDRPTGQHGHAVTDPGHAHDIGVRTTINAGNVPVGSIQANGSAPQAGVLGHTMAKATGLTVDDSAGAAGVAGTNAPYLQLLPCRKD